MIIETLLWLYIYSTFKYGLVLDDFATRVLSFYLFIEVTFHVSMSNILLEICRNKHCKDCMIVLSLQNCSGNLTYEKAVISNPIAKYLDKCMDAQQK